MRACPAGADAPKKYWNGISPQVKAWELGGRAETLRWFEENQFGRTPVGRLPDQVIGTSSVSFTNAGIRIAITCRLPAGADAAYPAPVFLFGDHRGGDRPPAYEQKEYPDIPTNVVRAADGWGTIGAWAWGNSRVMDWIESRPELDATRVAVLGHSRGGKTALWTGAQDERFAMTISNGSGCGGARLGRARDPKAETIRQILHNFPNWFCPNFAAWIDRDAELPHDADDLMRLIAPRLVYVASGSEDAWAGPAAEKAAWDAAHDLYRAYGLEERMGYHCHEGPHKLRPDDWEKFMDFADRHLKAPSTADSDEIDRRLAAALAPDGSRTLVLARNPAAPDGVWRLTRAIRVPSDFTLVFDGCRVELVDGTQDNIVRNAGAAEGACRPDRNLRILGRNGAVLSGGRRNHYRPRRSGDPNGWRAVGILLCDVNDYEIGGLRFEETQCWAISQERCSRGRVHDLVFGSTDLLFNQDGVDVRKGCHDLVIEDISGVTGDDAVALTAYRDPPGSPARYGMQIGGNADLGERDDIYNVTIRNVRARSAGGHGVIRLLTCDGIKMHHITVRNVTASGPVAVWVKGPLRDAEIVGVAAAPGGRKYDVTAPLRNVRLDPEGNSPVVWREPLTEIADDPQALVKFGGAYFQHAFNCGARPFRGLDRVEVTTEQEGEGTARLFLKELASGRDLEFTGRWDRVATFDVALDTNRLYQLTGVRFVPFARAVRERGIRVTSTIGTGRCTAAEACRFDVAAGAGPLRLTPDGRIAFSTRSSPVARSSCARSSERAATYSRRGRTTGCGPRRTGLWMRF